MAELDWRAGWRSPFAKPVTARDARFVRTPFAVEVRYGEVLPNGRLRFPRLARIRWDKRRSPDW